MKEVKKGNWTAKYIDNSRVRIGWWTKMENARPLHFSLKKRESFFTGEEWLYLMVRVWRLQIDWKLWRVKEEFDED